MAAAHAALSVLSALLRITWRSVAATVVRVVAEAAGRTDRLAGLRRIGIDEISYRKGRRYLLCVVDHDTGRLVRAGEDRNACPRPPTHHQHPLATAHPPRLRLPLAEAHRHGRTHPRQTLPTPARTILKPAHGNSRRPLNRRPCNHLQYTHRHLLPVITYVVPEPFAGLGYWRFSFRYTARTALLGQITASATNGVATAAITPATAQPPPAVVAHVAPVAAALAPPTIAFCAALLR